MLDKEKYKQLCAIEDSIPILLRDWWMDAVCGRENWKVILVEQGGKIVGAMPCYITKKLGVKYIIQPLLTQKNGIWIKYPQNQKHCTKLSFENKVVEEIIRRLSEFDVAKYSQNFDYNFSNWLPFYWKKFNQTTAYTYVIQEISHIDKVYNDFESKVRKAIRKAENIVKVKSNLDIKQFYDINKMTFDRQGIEIPYSYEFIKRLDNACVANNCRKIFYAEDEQKRIHAVLYIVWDENSAYGIMGGANPELRNSEAYGLLIWEAIKFSATVTKKFDFGGSMIEPIEKFFRAFGAVQKPYFIISKEMKNNFLFNSMMCIYSNNTFLRKIYTKLKR